MQDLKFAGTEMKLHPGDEIQVDWTDGLSKKATFLRRERGFVVFLDEDGMTGACVDGIEKITLIRRKND